MLWGGKRIQVPDGRRERGAIAAVGGLLVVLGAWWAHGYFYDADFYPAGSGYSETDSSTCHLGQAIYLGYPVVPNGPVRLTGAQLVDVPPSVTVEGIWVVKGGPLMTGFGEADWAKSGNPERMYPISGIGAQADDGSGWWLAVEVVPHAPGRQLLPGIRYSYTDGWRSGSSFAPDRVGLDCAR